MGEQLRISLYDHWSNEIETTPENLSKILGGCQRELGLEKKHRLPKIIYKNPSELRKLGLGAGYYHPEKTIILPPELSEAIVFHELVHHLMDKEKLIFKEGKIIARFYGTLINETLAEFATSSIFEYDTENVLIYPQNEVAEIVKKQREIQTVFVKRTETSRLPALVEELYVLLNSDNQSNQTLCEAVRLIAIENTLCLRDKGIKTPNLVGRVREAKERYSRPEKVYFASIVEALH